MSAIRALLLFYLCWMVPELRADEVGYGGRHTQKVENKALGFHHFHDWDAPAVHRMFRDFAHHDRIFSAENDFSWIELWDRERKTRLFRTPSPALLSLWISPDSKFFVGLSTVMYGNPYQLVIWRKDGTLLHREHIAAEVAKLSPESRKEFEKRYPKAPALLGSRYITLNGQDYLDFQFLDLWAEFGIGAHDFLQPMAVPHPYSNDFRSSVTNTIFWYAGHKAEPSLKAVGTGWELSLLSPRGKRFSVPIPGNVRYSNHVDRSPPPPDKAAK